MAVVQDVLLRVQGQWKATEVERGIARLNSALGKVMVEFTGSALAMGLNRVIDAMDRMVRSAIRLNQEYEQTRISLATVISTYNTFLDAQNKSLDRAKAWTASMREAEKVMRAIREEAVRTPFTMEELREYVKVGMGYGYAKGLTTQEIVRTISMLAQAAYTAGLPGGYPVVSEIRALLTGQNLRASQVAQMYGLSAQELQRLRGEDYLRYLRERLRGIEMASEEMSRSFTARWTSLMSSFNEILREIGSAVLPVLEEYLSKARDVLERWKQSGGPERLRQLVREVVDSLVSLVNMIVGIYKFFSENRTAMAALRSLTTGGIGAYIGAKVGGPYGATIGGVVGAAAPIVWEWGKGLYQSVKGEISRLPKEIPSYLRTPLGIVSGAVGYYNKRFNDLLETLGIPRLLPETPPPTTPQAMSAVGVPSPVPEAQRGKPAQAGVSPYKVVSRPLPPQMSVEDTIKSKARAEEEARRAKMSLLDVEEDRARQRLSSLMRKYTGMPFSEEAASEITTALREWEGALQKKVSASVEGLHPLARQAVLARYRMDLEEMRGGVREYLASWKESSEKREAEERAARFEDWRRWWGEVVEAYGGIREKAMYRAQEVFRQWYPRVGLLPAMVLAGREIQLGEQVLREQREREVSAQLAALQVRRERELAQRVRQEMGVQAEMAQYLYRTISGVLVPPRGLRGERAERWQLRRAYEMLGALGTMSGMGVLPLGAYEIVQRLTEIIDALERRLRERVEAFWESMAQGMESAFREAFVRMGEDLLSNLSRWREAFSRFAQTIKSMLIRALMEALYERVVRRLVDQLVDVVVGAVSGKGGERRVVGASVGAVLGGAVGGPVGALVGGLLGGLIGGRQWGGVVYPRRLYLVGEKGPELFVPAVMGKVVPMEQAAQVNPQISVNITAPSREIANYVAREIVRELRLAGLAARR